MVSLNLPHHPFLLLYLVLLLLSKEIVEKGVPITFWDLREAKGGGCLHSLQLEETLLTAVLAQMLESGYCCWPKTGSKLGSGSVLMLLETRPWRGCTNLPSNISLLLSSRNWWKTAPHPSPWWQLPRKSREKLGKLGLTRYWKRTRWLRFNFLQLTNIYIPQLFHSSSVSVARLFFSSILKASFFRRSCSRKVYNIMVMRTCLIAAISNLLI